MTLVSEKYGNFKYLYNINDIRNLESIFQYGILSKNEIRKHGIYAFDLSDEKVQLIRETKRVPNLRMLHDYANLFFNPRNPMMYRLISNCDLNDLCIICIDKRVLYNSI